jgi:hypothetical protein
MLKSCLKTAASPYNKERITINEFNNNVCEFDNEKAPIQIK